MFIEEMEDKDMMARCHTVYNRDLVIMQNTDGEVYYAAWPEMRRGFEIMAMFGKEKFSQEDWLFIQKNSEKLFVLLASYFKNVEPFYTVTEGSSEEAKNAKYILTYHTYNSPTGKAKVGENVRLIDIYEEKFFKEETAFATRDEYMHDDPYGKGRGKNGFT